MSRQHSRPLHSVIRRFGRQRVLVLGDMVADVYLIGEPARISREAPVLILHFRETFVRAGSATNAAYNVARLGGAASVVGVVGDDESGRRLRQALADAGVDVRHMLVDPHRSTSTKTRIVGRGAQQVQQQIVRIDRVDTHPVPPGVRDTMIDAVCAALGSIDALLLSDYEGSVISPELINACLPEARRRGVRVVVDSHGDLFRFQGITAATPNQPEAAATLGESLDGEQALDRGGTRLLEGMDAQGVLITRGAEGIALYERGRPPYKLPVARDGETAVDPTGAGDSVAAVFTLALAAGATMRQGAYLGNVMGSEIVRRFGTAALTSAELRGALRSTQLVPPEE